MVDSGLEAPGQGAGDQQNEAKLVRQSAKTGSAELPSANTMADDTTETARGNYVHSQAGTIENKRAFEDGNVAGDTAETVAPHEFPSKEVESATCHKTLAVLKVQAKNAYAVAFAAETKVQGMAMTDPLSLLLQSKVEAQLAMEDAIAADVKVRAIELGIKTIC